MAPTPLSYFFGTADSKWFTGARGDIFVSGVRDQSSVRRIPKGADFRNEALRPRNGAAGGAAFEGKFKHAHNIQRVLGRDRRLGFAK
jgi:hypothetical protein